MSFVFYIAPFLYKENCSFLFFGRHNRLVCSFTRVSDRIIIIFLQTLKRIDCGHGIFLVHHICINVTIARTLFDIRLEILKEILDIIIIILKIRASRYAPAIVYAVAPEWKIWTTDSEIIWGTPKETIKLVLVYKVLYFFISSILYFMINNCIESLNTYLRSILGQPCSKNEFCIHSHIYYWLSSPASISSSWICQQIVTPSLVSTDAQTKKAQRAAKRAKQLADKIEDKPIIEDKPVEEEKTKKKKSK